ncbi:MAG: exodeoxyribonuclease VII large subunit [Saprospiraceae bacterium]
MQKYTLLELNEFIKKVIALNLPDELWINCEISQAGRSRGQMYLEFIQKDEVSNQILAQSKAILWSRDYHRIRKEKGEVIDQILQNGQSVLVKVKAEYSERYGLSLVIKDIDTAFTLGKMALKRQKTIDELLKLGLIGRNKVHELPLVIQRIAVISSETAAGYQDFTNQLKQNEWQYKFQTELVNAAMQGEKTADEVSDGLKYISANAERYDIVVIIRGGGAKLDLAAFDHFNIAKNIAQANLPVLTGIGHEIDDTIADMVAHTKLKTPTAVADFIIQHNIRLEGELEQIYLQIVEKAHLQCQSKGQSLQNIEHQLIFLTQNMLKDADRLLDYIDKSLPKNIKQNLKNKRIMLEGLERNIALLSPENALKRGFTITLKNGVPMTSQADLEVGDVIQTVLKDGQVSSIVE